MECLLTHTTEAMVASSVVRAHIQMSSWKGALCRARAPRSQCISRSTPAALPLNTCNCDLHHHLLNHCTTSYTSAERLASPPNASHMAPVS